MLALAIMPQFLLFGLVIWLHVVSSSMPATSQWTDDFESDTSRRAISPPGPNEHKRSVNPHINSAKQCRAPEVFTECGSSCVRTCSDLSSTAPCDEECVAECRCPEGQLLNSLGSCILRVQCPFDLELHAGIIDKRVGSAPCVKGDWVKSFDRQGWSTCAKEYPFITGLERSRSLLPFMDFILHLEGAECCSTTAASYECTVVSLVSTIHRINTWNVCPDGYFLSGLYRNNGKYLNSINQAKCCKSTNLPASYQNCYDEDVTNLFDHNKQGMKTCQRSGYYMTGFFKSNCNFLYCIEKFKCCSPSESKPKPCYSSPCKNEGTCTNDGDSYSCKCSPGYKGNTCEEEPKPKPCDSSPCKNEGICTNEGYSFSCECSQGYKGETCEVGSASCVKGDWVKSFDRPGWSTCPKEYPCISGLERSTSPLPFMDFILHLEGAECCSTTAASYECTVVSLIRTIRRINTWNVCPDGYFLSGLYRNNGKYLNSINQAKCCKSTDRPASYQNCYDEDVTNLFDHNDQGMKTCQRPGYYMTGFFKSNCNFLYCIENFKCCSPSEIQVNNPCGPNPCKNGGKCFTVGGRFSCRCQPKFGGPTCEEERAVCEAQGDPHYTTFDRRRFNFMGVKCEYVFVQDCSADKAFNVFTNNVPCGRGGASCVSTVKVQLHGKEILFTTAAGLVRIDGALFKKFPVIGEGYVITLPSKNQVLLTSDVGLEVSWDFRNLVRVAVSGKYKTKTCGLCGNYDGNGNNDKFSPADLKCEQKPASSLQCRPSWVTRIVFAKCDLIANSPFSTCHRTVDPVPFIDDCKYDACRCTRPMSCVCASVAAYVQECAKNDVIINWRFGVDVYRPLAVCAQRCLVRGQSFTECGSSCARTCRDLSNEFQCNEECVPVCSCPDGQVLSDRMQCVPVSQCPCSHGGKNYLPGQSIRVRKCQTCFCHNGGMYCVEKEGCATEPCDSSPCKNGGVCTNKGNSFSCKCTTNFIGATCEKEIPNPCKPNPCKNGGSCEVLGTRFSCRCKPQFGGATCEYGQSICEAHGDPHYITFDKRKFNFMGVVCNYVFAEDCSVGKAFSVLTKNIKCGRWSAACTAAVTMRIAGYEIKLSRAVRTAVVNGVKIRKFPIKRPGFVITNPALTWLRVTTNIGLSVIWNCRTIVRVAVSGHYKGKTCGLCGNNDGNRVNDVVDPKLLCAPESGDVHRCQPTLETLSIVAKCNAMGAPFTPFSTCRSLVNPAQLIKDCKYDACRCNDPMQCVCAAFATYSKQCSDNGNVLAWRFKGTNLYKPLEQCAKKCENVGEIFTECSSSCAQTCRDLSSDIQCNEECVPGCECPNGQVLDDAKRCVPKAECPCHFEGKVVQPGDNVDVGNCITCTCNNGAMTCLDDRDCANKGPCDSFPCKNDGICSSEGNSFLCKCTEDYQGETCKELKPTPCDSSPCKNGGVCSNEGESFLCECEGGYEGKTCKIEPIKPKPCDSSPCKNGGICTNEGESFSCKCVEDFQGETCEVFNNPKPCDSSPCASGSVCENSGGNYVCKCTPDFTGKHCEESTCKDGKLDLLYVVDGSGSVRKRNFQKVKQFTQELSGRFDIGSDKTRVGFMQFGRASKTRLEFGLGKENTIGGVNTAINRIKYLRARTETGDALRKAREEIFNGKNGDRSGVGNVLILFTDGQASDKNRKLQLEEAEKLKGQGVTIITVAMGQEKTITKFRNALETMASEASSGKKLQFEANFSEFGAILDSLVKESCQGQKCTVKEIVAKCDSSCALSCRDLARDANCGEECGTRCRCAKGELFNDHLKCVAVAECPCQHQGKEIGPGKQVAVGKCKTCTCTNGLMECQDKGGCKPEPCDSLPCDNGGTCSNVFGDSFSCECPENYQGTTCSEPKHKPCDSSPCKNGGTCNNEGDSFLCNCAEVFEGETCEEAKCKGTKLDLLFVVDGSGSVRKANFAKIEEFIQRLNKKFDVSRDKTRIALVQFGEPVKTRIEFNLGDKNTLDEVNKGVADMTYLRSQTATGDALRKAREQVFNGEDGDRPDAPNVLILFTDGQATDKGGKNVQVKEAQKLKDDGVKVITVGMGVQKTISRFRSKLEDMASKASDSDKPLEFEAEFEQLDSIANALVKEACNSAGKS